MQNYFMPSVFMVAFLAIRVSVLFGFGGLGFSKLACKCGFQAGLCEP